MLAAKVVALGLALVVLGSPARHTSHQNAVSRSSRLQAGIVARVNAFRAAHGLSRLNVSVSLRNAASAHSTEMAVRGYFSHNSADGLSFSQRIARYYSARGYRSWTVGENLAWASPGMGAAETLKLWLSSPPHRANLLDPRWRELGISAVHAASAPGVYRNAPTTIVTADFGARSR